MSDDSNVTPAPAGNPNDLPEWAREAISRANSEAAERRIQIRELERQLADVNEKLAAAVDAKSAAEKTAGDSTTELMRLRIALDAGVPGERVRSIAARLKGSTEEELKADAEALVNEFGLNSPPATAQRAVDPSQARSGSSSPVPSTPNAEFAQLFSNLDVFKR